MSNYRRRILANQLKHQEIAYIQNEYGQYVDINYYPNSETQMTLTSQFINRSEYNSLGFAWIAGSRVYTTMTSRFEVYYSASAGSIRFQAIENGTSGSVSLIEKGTSMYDKHTYYVDNVNGFVSLDGEQISEINMKNFGTSPMKFRLFGDAFGGSYYSVNKFYGLKLSDNGILKCDIIPVLKNDGTACLYDKVNNKYYYPNKGAFSWGND